VQLAERINSITVSPTLAVMAEAERYKARGIDVVDFGPGEPDFPTPENIKRAAIAAIEQNFTKYTPTAGIAPLRKAICDWHATQFGSAYAPNECIVSVGGKHAIFNAVSVLINPGDEVLIPAPYWVSFPDIVKYAGGRPEIIETTAKDGFQLRAEQVDRAIGPRTRILIVNSPCNPTGAVVPPDEFVRILDVCKRRGIWLLSDECYSHFVYGDARPYSVAGVAESKPHLITIGSCSKTFSMTGWRMGYALAPAPLVDAMLKLQSQSTSNPTSIAQRAALEALTGPMESVGTMLAEYARRRERIVAGLRAIRGVTCTEPQGAFYVFPNFDALLGRGISSTTDLARQLLEREHIAVVPGEAFGAPGYLRLSYATSMERIEEGLKRLGRFFQLASAAS
jgi:aspartate aminotransferase